MKNLISLLKTSLVLSVLLISSFVAACSSDDDSSVTPEIIIPQNILDNGMVFAKTGGENTLSIKSNVPLEVTSSASDWCKVTAETSASNAVFKYTIKVDANTTTDNRTSTIAVAANGTKIDEFTVTQTAADGLDVETTEFKNVKNEGEVIQVKLKANGDFSFVINDTWIKEATPTRAMTERTKDFKIEANYGAARKGTITFILGGITGTVTIEQLAGSMPDTGMESDAMTLAAKIYAGWNLGNTLEAIGGETNWGNPKTTETLIKQVKALGFNAIRIPCSWDQYIDNQFTYKIKDSWLDRVNEVVGYCVLNDVYAIVNIHWDGGWLENNCTVDKKDENNKKQKALWTQIANKLNHFDEHLLFAGCNEPNVQDAAQMEVLKSYEQTFIDAVRATGGNNAKRNLIVQGPSTDVDKTYKLFGAMPTDVVANRLMVEVHYYTPWTFCGLEKDESWGKMAYFWGPYKVEGSDRNAVPGDEAEVKNLFAKMKAQFVDNRIPVILGEYGAMVRTGLGANQQAHDKSRGAYDEVVTREAKNYGLIPFFWDGGGFAMINRSTGAINDNYAFDGIMKGAKAGRYPY